MKTQKFTYYVSLIFMIVFTTNFSYSQDWASINSGITDNINDLEFLDENAGIAVGDAGRIVGTIDGGESWNLIPSGTVENLNGIVAVSQTEWLLCGDNGTILRSMNAGLTWIPVTSGVAAHLNAIEFFDANNGMITGDAGTILTTVDGGQNWTLQNSTTTNNLFGNTYSIGGNMHTVGNGIINPTLLVSYNSGVNWTSQTSTALNNLSDIEFTDDNTGYAVGQLGTLLETTDGGTNWGASTISAANLTKINFVNDSVGFIVGASGTILKTEDYGAGWTPLTSNSAEEIRSIEMLSSLSGYAVGTNGEILKTCPTAAFTSSEVDSVCQGTTVAFVNESSSADDYLWLVDGDTIATTTDFQYAFMASGTINVELIASNFACQGQSSQSFVVTSSPTVDLGNDTTICTSCSDTLVAPAGYTYQWFYNGTFNGNISDVQIASSPGEYVVEVTNSLGCLSSDTINVMMTNSISESVLDKELVRVYPNPAIDFVMIDIEGMENETNYSLVNMLGAVIEQGTFDQPKNQLDISNLPAGMYYLNISDAFNATKVMISKR